MAFLLTGRTEDVLKPPDFLLISHGPLCKHLETCLIICFLYKGWELYVGCPQCRPDNDSTTQTRTRTMYQRQAIPPLPKLQPTPSTASQAPSTAGRAVTSDIQAAMARVRLAQTKLRARRLRA